MAEIKASGLIQISQKRNGKLSGKSYSNVGGSSSESYYLTNIEWLRMRKPRINIEFKKYGFFTKRRLKVNGYYVIKNGNSIIASAQTKELALKYAKRLKK